MPNKPWNMICRSRPCKGGNREEELFDQSMGREWEDKSWEQVCFSPFLIPLKSTNRLQWNHYLSIAVDAIFAMHSSVIYNSLVKGIGGLVQVSVDDALQPGQYEFKWKILYRKHPHLFRFLISNRIRRKVMWKFLTWINWHNCDRAAKKVSAILSWENTKKANIEAQLKKIEVISFTLLFDLLRWSFLLSGMALTKVHHLSYILIET